MSPIRQLVSDIHAESRNTAFQRMFRRRSLWILCVPVVLALIAFALATTILTRQFTPDTFTGAWRLSGVASFGYLILAFLYSPAYLAGLTWFFWGTRVRGTDARSRLLVMPVVMALFAWCPVMLVPSLSMEDRIATLAGLVPTALIVGFLWSFFVRWVVSLSLRKHPALAT
ncbi:hypothetical protein [Achromobacter insolitus]|uniref:hypothetical protein n=1 Tax=Achromobacter insolitus TaxID=217204 RepID=UPI001041E119|nr:hypothetical protein [Achromobacter insolitus]